MRRPIVSRRAILVVAICICAVTLSFAGASTFGPRSAASAGPPKTHVCGRIATDTTWTTTNSPYEMDCNVTLPAGVTLTIQPGVVVYAAASVKLQVKGVLKADGTSG